MTVNEGEEVELIRSFAATNMELGVGMDDITPQEEAEGLRPRFFVFDRDIGRTAWHRHCGPYGTWQEAADWINAIRATTNRD